MAKYRLLAGQHVQADKSKPLHGPDGKPTGRFERRTFKAGDVVESDTDLVAKCGPQHFGYVDAEGKDARIADLERQLAEAKAAARAGRQPGDPTPDNQATGPAVFPGGQVSTGFQGTSGPKGSGPLHPDDFERGGANSPPPDAGKAEPKKAAPPRAAAKPAGPSDDDLEGMSVDELHAHAAAEEVELHGARTKADIVKAIKKGRR